MCFTFQYPFCSHILITVLVFKKLYLYKYITEFLFICINNKINEHISFKKYKCLLLKSLQKINIKMLITTYIINLDKNIYWIIKGYIYLSPCIKYVQKHKKCANFFFIQLNVKYNIYTVWNTHKLLSLENWQLFEQ